MKFLSGNLFPAEVPPRYREICDAVNVAMLSYIATEGKRGLHPDTHYAPVWNSSRDAWDCEFWSGDRLHAERQGRIVRMTDKEVLAGAPKQSEFGEGVAS